MTELNSIAPAFIEMAHRIVWATVATVDPTGQPRTRVLHPMWEWNGHQLTGWIATGPDTPKAGHLDVEPRISLDLLGSDTRHLHRRLRHDPARHRRGQDNSVEPIPHRSRTGGVRPVDHPFWHIARERIFRRTRAPTDSPRVFPGTLLLQGEGDLLRWTETCEFTVA